MLKEQVRYPPPKKKNMCCHVHGTRGRGQRNETIVHPLIIPWRANYCQHQRPWRWILFVGSPWENRQGKYRDARESKPKERLNLREAATAEEENEDSSDEELAYINKGKYRPRKKHIGPPNKFNKRSPIKCFAAQCPVNPHSSFYHGPRRSQFKKHNLGYIGNKNDKKAINLLSIGSRGFFLPFHGLTHNCFSGIYAWTPEWQRGLRRRRCLKPFKEPNSDVIYCDSMWNISNLGFKLLSIVVLNEDDDFCLAAVSMVVEEGFQQSLTSFFRWVKKV